MMSTVGLRIEDWDKIQRMQLLNYLWEF